ncbi:ABC transporter permease [Agrobacterium sp. T29]|uniref:ABC transporter permease n=1 Tax=Agrobacterium sp. T29 TaxID=2580515 RepID=UPI00115D3A2B|nr:ABC transporter permease [Agrobacterium sp. T29]
MNTPLILEAIPNLFEGLLLTVQLTFLSVLVGLLMATPLALLRASPRFLFSLPIQVYTFAFRGTPLLVQLFLIYYGSGQLEWIRTTAAWTILREPYWCALIAFSLNNAAYTTEVIAGGIRAVPAGEVEAAKALGMSGVTRIRRIILPIGFRLALPAYANEVVLMLKASSLASTITLMELTGASRKIVAQTFSPYEVFASAAVIYLSLTFLIVFVFSKLEKLLNKHTGRDGSRSSNSQRHATSSSQAVTQS